ncbi:MAG: ATP-dependent Clp protease adaptor ClpS [Ignavibacteriales bacterium]|nr:ATP-dependent Clp protease adaptor ClpS [Ignavibacteriales bacterium]
MPEKEREQPVAEPELTTEEDAGLSSRVLLFNDDWHTFEEVIAQIVKATNCGFDKARDLAFEAHVKGRAVVYTGELQRCLRVSSILEEIELRTQILS